MKMFNKLVRDKIPEIIESSGEVPTTRVLTQEEYLACLQAKLDEEVREFHESNDVEELADILEVVCALAEAYGYSREALVDCYHRKHDARGGFRKRIMLIGKTEKNQKT